MKPGTDRRAGATARSHGRRRRGAGLVAATLGVWAVALTGLAPAAAADDVQSQQWYLDAMSADQLWNVSTGKDITVAVIDSGVSETKSLEGKVLPGKDVTGTSGGPTDDYDGHGTSMAELIAGSGKDGSLKGLAPDAKVVPYRVTLTTLPGKHKDDTYKAIREAADGDARIINMSIGGQYWDPQEESAIKYALSKGKLLFASVGNESSSKTEYPASYRGVVGVSAADENGTVAKFSEYNDSVDLASPGADVPSWCDKTLKRYCKSEGTSQASAIASASAALIWSAHPDWTANQVLRVLIDTAGRDWPKDSPSKYLGYGLIRPARNLLHHEGDPGPADVDPITGEKTPGVASSSGTSAAGSASQDPDGKASGDASSAGKDSSQGTSGGETSAAAATADSSDGNGTLWTVVAAVAAVVVVGGGIFAFVRKRRTA
ncbi:type VII secretion-associated serine protease [Streptomyces sulfonofaciens]|uniref:Type VII secretion-associated serine protease n=1 Tax=Streptomyces sulfonofaciens TaxID=68272 RepID=A0A919L953_9ACTN|nr:S8 family serine peptidase [Streptomyces sulfonofaciens]GHH88029.1 type VII secretion-associated serine protease [Streptomyces sulfonofaciens]